MIGFNKRCKTCEALENGCTKIVQIRRIQPEIRNRELADGRQPVWCGATNRKGLFLRRALTNWRSGRDTLFNVY